MDYVDALPIYMAIADGLPPLTVPVDVALKIASFLTVSQDFSFENYETAVNYRDYDAPMKKILLACRKDSSYSQQTVREAQASTQPFADFTYPPNTPRLNAIEHSGYLASIQTAAMWKDQGWGNMKASIFVSVERNCLLSAYLHGRCQLPDGIHGNSGRLQGIHEAPRSLVVAAVATAYQSADTDGDEKRELKCQHGFEVHDLPVDNAHHSDRSDQSVDSDGYYDDTEFPGQSLLGNREKGAEEDIEITDDAANEWKTVWHSRLLFCDRRTDAIGSAVSRNRGWNTTGNEYLFNAQRAVPSFEGGLVPGDTVGFAISPGAGGGHAVTLKQLFIRVEFSVGEMVPPFLYEFIDAHRRDKTLRKQLVPPPNHKPTPATVGDLIEMFGPLQAHSEPFLSLDQN